MTMMKNSKAILQLGPARHAGPGSVMPVPDQVRDDGSGIQQQDILEKQHWIPGQARNDRTVGRTTEAAIVSLSTEAGVIAIS